MSQTSRTDKGTRRNLVTVDLQGFKEPWLAWCQSQGLSPSEALRRLVARESGVSSPVTVRGRPERPALRPKVALTIAEWTQLQPLAEKDGVSIPRWIVNLVRVHLLSEPQLGRPELLELERSTEQLQAIGRNLNQVARALNSINEQLQHGRKVSDPAGALGPERLAVLQAIERLQGHIQAHIPIVSDVLTKNVARWAPKVARRDLGARR